MSSYRKGYRLGAWRSGYLEGSAVPIRVDKVHHLVEYLDSLVPSIPPTLARLVVERDALLALLMWETSMRGKTCEGVTLSDFFQPDGHSLKLPLPSPLPMGSLLTLRPNGTAGLTCIEIHDCLSFPQLDCNSATGLAAVPARNNAVLWMQGSLLALMETCTHPAMPDEACHNYKMLMFPRYNSSHLQVRRGQSFS